MNDFLQTLRSSHTEKQRTRMTRRSYDEAFSSAVPKYQYASQTAVQFQPPRMMQDSQSDSSRLHQAIDKLNNQMKDLALNQNHLTMAQEKAAVMLERQVTAIEKVLDHLKIPSI